MTPPPPILPEGPASEPLGYARRDQPGSVGGWSAEPWPTEPQPGDPGLGTDRPRQGFLRGRLAPIGAAILAFLAKLKAILLFLPKVKLLATSGTMLVSIAAYATIWGFQFALGFVILILVHEMGHVIALRREGIKATAPMFIPFLGAVISARSLGDNAAAEARVGLAGPVLGTIGAAACIPLWQATGNDLFRALAFTGFFLNLFNLLPVIPLDGGRAMAAMAPAMWAVGFLAMVALAIVFPNPIILIIAVVAGWETYKRWQQRRRGNAETLAYYRVAAIDRALIAAVYLGLIALLVVGMDATHLARTLA
ncbi:MAG TPA: site-2 protease family protein [Solirubrobacteraceae bacterium]